MQKYQLIKFEDGDFQLDVRTGLENETVWLTQNELAALFCVDRTRINRHINNIYKEGELDKKSTCAESAHMGSTGVQQYKVRLYNLDMIISVGYRVNSKRGITFRRWQIVFSRATFSNCSTLMPNNDKILMSVMTILLNVVSNTIMEDF